MGINWGLYFSRTYGGCYRQAYEFVEPARFASSFILHVSRHKNVVSSLSLVGTYQLTTLIGKFQIVEVMQLKVRTSYARQSHIHRTSWQPYFRRKRPNFLEAGYG